jgi:hypothetical protein
MLQTMLLAMPEVMLKTMLQAMLEVKNIWIALKGANQDWLGPGSGRRLRRLRPRTGRAETICEPLTGEPFNEFGGRFPTAIQIA